MSIYQQLADAGVPLDCHESDLYAKVTPESRTILKGYEFRRNCSVFQSNIDGCAWYEIPFANDPFWISRKA